MVRSEQKRKAMVRRTDISCCDMGTKMYFINDNLHFIIFFHETSRNSSVDSMITVLPASLRSNKMDN
jgi:hypothetical protein